MNEAVTLFYKYGPLFKKLTETAWRAYKGFRPKYDKYKYCRSLYTSIRTLVEESNVANTLLDLEDFQQELTISWLKILDSRSSPDYAGKTQLNKHLLRVGRWDLVKLVEKQTKANMPYPAREEESYIPNYLIDPIHPFSLDLKFMFFGDKEGPFKDLPSVQRQLLYRMYNTGWDRFEASLGVGKRPLTCLGLLQASRAILKAHYQKLH